MSETGFAEAGIPHIYADGEVILTIDGQVDEYTSESLDDAVDTAMKGCQ